MPTSTSSLTNLTRNFWQQRTNETVTAEDARQIIGNVYGFFMTLSAWDNAVNQAFSGTVVCSVAQTS